MLNSDPPIPFEEWMTSSRVYGFIDSYKLLKKHKSIYESPICHPTTKIESFRLNIVHLCWCGFDMPDHHNALADAQALSRIFNTKPFKKYFPVSVLLSNVLSTKDTWRNLNQQTGIELKRQLESQAPKRKREFDYTDEFVGDENWKCCTQCITFLSTLEKHECPKKKNKCA
jgi:hypothetical protein